MERLSREFLDRVSEGERAAVRIWLGWALLNQGRSREAADCFEETLEQRSDLADAVLGLFWVALLQGDAGEAVSEAERFAGLAAAPALGQARRFEAYLRTGDTARAESLARQAPAILRTARERRTLHGELAMGYLGAGRFAEAEAELRRAIGLMSEEVVLELQARLGWVLTLRGEYDDAWAALQRGLEQSPRNAALALLDATNELARGDAEAAERRARDLLASGPADARTYRVLAYSLAAQGRFREAEPFARRQRAMAPNREGLVALAWILITGELDREEGVDLAEEALRIDESPHAAGWRLPFIPSPQECLGVAYLDEGRYEKAVEMLEAAQRLRPDRSSVRARLAQARAGAGG